MVTADSTQIQPETLARELVDVASERKASDIVLLDLRGVSIIADFFVICSGSSERQINALSQALVERADEMGVPTRRIEGSSASGWVLIDFLDVMVHIFAPEQRAFYKLDELWKEAKPLLLIQ
ncbi:iojap-like protein [Thermobaculum terrenum ATCC BAA-798]|uniref:Ribosomal silencing factor RsfS n=1 Tax=Thermobaculum terrenum (strain ATCC BAA-798 / CCMEE 7001 / YNP1) TaxID=525904 RepID=D1CCZ4_THET1|nr:ribosome silencing factor [Thermobaculum terrenum]ACZ42659.1 iojap-like protein [Thermobaculum terrenum ATCC BAA-798]